MKEEWHEQRRQGIGGSDTPVILSKSPWKSRQELWGEKLGFRKDGDPSPAMKRGTAMEPMIAEMYQGVTHRKLKTVNEILKHPKHNWMIGNIDRLVEDPEKGAGVLEIKSPGLKNYGNIERNGVPEMYYLQIQHYLAVTGLFWASFCAHNSERWSMVYYDIDRDDSIINMIIEKDAEFWEMVQKEIEPEEEIITDLDIPKYEGKLITMDSPDWLKAVDQLALSRTLTEEVAILEADAKQKIITMLGNAEGAESPGFRVYYKLQSCRKTFDKVALAKDYPKIDLNKYMKQGKDFKTFKPFFIQQKED